MSGDSLIMNKMETLSALKRAGSPMDIDVELLKNYCKHFSDISKDDRDNIFDSFTRGIIGEAMKREWDKVTTLMEKGYNNVETPTGHRIYRERHSKVIQKWKALIPDTMPVQRCKDIFKDICDRWEPAMGGKIKKQPIEDEVPF